MKDLVQPTKEAGTPTPASFFFNIPNNNPDEKTFFLDAWAGCGKTQQFVEHVLLCLADRNCKNLVYAARTIQEVVEVYKRIEDTVRAKYGRNTNKYMIKIFPSFQITNFDKQLSDLPEELKEYVRTKMEHASTRNVKRIKASKVVLTTHASLMAKYKLFKDYTVVCDEMPEWLLNFHSISKGGKNFNEIGGELPLNNKVYSFLGFNRLSQALQDGLLVSEVLADEDTEKGKNKGKRVSAEFLNPNHHFKTLFVMSAWPVKCLQWMSITGKGKHIQSKANPKLRLDFDKNTHTTVLEGYKGSATARRYNSSSVLFELLSKYEGESILIDFNGQNTQLPSGVQQICWNKTGLNSLSGIGVVAVASAFFYCPDTHYCMKRLYGDNLDLVQAMEGGAKMLQSIYRSRVRKGEKIELVVGDSRVWDSILTVLDGRYTELPSMRV